MPTTHNPSQATPSPSLTRASVWMRHTALVALVALTSTFAVVGGAAPASAAPTIDPVPLGRVSSFAVLTPAAVGNAAPEPVTVLRGDVGSGGALTGFPPGMYTGTLYLGAATGPAVADLQIAWDNAKARPAGELMPGELGGTTAGPGVHTSAAAVGMAADTTFTIDAQGDPSAVFIFQVNGALALGANITVNLTGGAQAHNVFWAVTGAGGIGADAVFAGTLIATTAVTSGHGSMINGRLTSLGGAITMSGTDLYSSPPIVEIDGGPIASTMTSSPTITGTTSLRSPSTVAVEVVGIGITPGLTVSETGTWSFEPGPLANGTYTIVARVVDGANNTGSYTQILTVDTTPPVVTIDGGDTAATRDMTPTISGTTDVAAGERVTITLTNSTTTLTRTTLVQDDLTWNITPNGLTAGTWTIVATVTDPAGNTNTATQHLDIDTQAPIVTITSADLTNDANPTITGITEAGAMVTVSVDGRPVDDVTVTDTNWSATHTGTILGDGDHHVAVTATDTVGNTALASQTLTVDTVAPTVTIDPGPADSTNDRTPTITGTATVASGVTLTVTIGAGSPMFALVGSGTWNVTPDALLDEGTYTVTATVADPAGNVGTGTQQLTVDVTAPVVTLDGGASRTSFDATPNLTGSATGAPEGSAVVVTIAGQTLTTTIAADGTFAVTAALLTNGNHVVFATVTDTAGNTGNTNQSLTIDAVQPTVTIDGGLSRETNDATPRISGTSSAAAGASVTVTVAGQTLRAFVQPGGTWNVTAAQIDNSTVTVSVSIVDAYGNTGTNTQELTVDSTTPTSIVIDGGSDRSTNDTTPMISGTTSAADGRILVVTIDGQTLEVVAADGTWSVTAGHLADGTYPVTVTASDVGGNPGSASQLLTIDTVDPTVDIEPTDETDDPTPTFSGVDATPGSTVTVTVAGQTLTTIAASDGTWSVTPTTPLAAGEHTVTVTITDPAGNTGTGTQTITITEPPPTTTPTNTTPTNTTPTTTTPTNTTPPATTPTTQPDAEYTSVGPKRVFDTRAGSPTALRSVPAQQVGGGYELEVRMTDLAGFVPASGVGAVSLNVTSTRSVADGYITVYACGTREVVSSVNFRAGQTVANAVIAPVSANGTVCFYALHATDIIVDINGWFAAGAAFHNVGPKRVFDTRAGASPDALRDVTKSKLAADTTIEVQLTDLAGYVPAIGVGSVSMNVVVTNPEAPGYITVYACGNRAEVSSVNFRAGQTIANAVIAPVSANGTVCFYTLATTDLVVDINGWIESGSDFHGVDPARVLDTRPGSSPEVLRDVAKAKIGGGNVLQVQVTDLAGYVPASGVAAVSLNVTATNTEGPGFVTVFACGAMEEVSSLNFNTAGQTVANAVITPVSADGTICLFSSVRTNVIVDINGWIGTGPGA